MLSRAGSSALTSTTASDGRTSRFDPEETGLLGREARKHTWILYVLVVVFIVTAVSNGANITDGIDGLAAGTSAIIVLALGVLTYIGGNIVFAQYLDVMYIPGIGELVVFIGALLGACIGFLWFNSPPAMVFDGHAKVRYRQTDQPCRVEVGDGQLHISFDVPQRAITPGQSVVLYQGDICLGGAVIEHAFNH